MDLGIPRNEQFFLGSISNYPYEQRFHQTLHPDFRRDQYFRYPVQAAGLEETRGHQTEVSRAATRLIPPSYEETIPPDPREKLRRRTVDRDTIRQEEAVRGYETEWQILRFVIFTEEDVPYSAIEERRTRVMQLWWYLGDGTVRIFEPREDNSGLIQGEFFARNPPPALDDADGYPLELEDLAPVGAAFHLFGRRFVVADADRWTRGWFQREAGIDLGEPVSIPPTYHHAPTARQHDRFRPTKVSLDAGFQENAALGFYSRAPDTRGRFMQNRGKVLRFECIEDRRDQPFGDVLVMALHFFLEDDTLEVVFPPQENTGRGEFSKLLKRQRVPRMDPGPASEVGPDATRRRLGILSPDEAKQEEADAAQTRARNSRYRSSPGSWSGTFVSPITGEPLYRPRTADGGRKEPGKVTIDPFQSHPEPAITHITPELLVVGQTIHVFGHALFLRRGDPFTIQWYDDEMGLDQRSDWDNAPLISLGTEDTQSADDRLFPPHEGIVAIGDEEETRRNADKLVPRYRATQDREQAHQLKGKVLRFLARLDGPEGPEDVETVPLDPQDKGRRFVVNYFLEDDTMSVFERVSANSGRQGGKFLDRGRYRRFMPPREVEATRSSRGSEIGYEHGYGQGYPGGPLGKEDHVGAGPTGVSPIRGVGVEAFGKPADSIPPFFAPSDIRVGSRVTFHHSPSQSLRIMDADEFTQKYFERSGWDLQMECKESDSDDATEKSSRTGSHRERQSAMLRIAQSLVGCFVSLERHLRRFDRHGTGLVAHNVAATALLRYSSRMSHQRREDREAVLDSHADGNDSVQYVRMIQALRDANESAAGRQDALSKTLDQLRSALTSSRKHLRHACRNLGLACPGAVTPDEFWSLLRAHHLDIGLTREEVLSLMQRFPPAQSGVGAPEGSIDWTGFLRYGVLHDPSDAAELGRLQRVVEGIHDPLPGAGTAPEVRQHPPRGSAWGPDPNALPTQGPLAWKATKAKAEGLERVLGKPADNVWDSMAARGTCTASRRTSPVRQAREEELKQQEEPPPAAAAEEEEEEEEEEEAAQQARKEIQLSGQRTPDRKAAAAKGSPDTLEHSFVSDHGGRTHDPSSPMSVSGDELRSDLWDRLCDFFAARSYHLRRTFLLYDTNCSGFVSRKAAVNALQSAGFVLRLAEADTLFPRDQHEVDYHKLVADLCG